MHLTGIRGFILRDVLVRNFVFSFTRQSIVKRGGCVIAEQTKMNDCYFDKKDWRVCANEVCVFLCLSV